jgi:hypothetical protein
MLEAFLFFSKTRFVVKNDPRRGEMIQPKMIRKHFTVNPLLNYLHNVGSGFFLDLKNKKQTFYFITDFVGFYNTI